MTPRHKRIARWSVVGVGLVALYTFAQNGEWLDFFSMLAVFVLGYCVWLAFVRETTCDVEVRISRLTIRGCRNPAKGRLRACRLPDHEQVKRDELLRKLGLALLVRTGPRIWLPTRADEQLGPSEPQNESTTEAPTGRLTQQTRDMTILVCTLISTMWATVGGVFTLATL